MKVMKKSSAKNGHIVRNTYLFDCEADGNFGRIATQVAFILQGKHKAEYEPHIDHGDFVIVVNAAKIRFTGKKGEQKKYHHFSGYPGGIRTKKLSGRLEVDPEKVMREAVYGMLPKNKLRDKMIKKLVIKKDANHGSKVKFANQK